MSFKTTGILLLLFALLGSYAYFYVGTKPPAPKRQTTFMYQYEMSDIVRMEVQYKGESTSMVWDNDSSEWRFTDPTKGAVDSSRANGIRLLLSGPGTHRVFLQESATPEQLKEYGLANPQVVATIALRDGIVHRVLVGDRTHDGRNYYTKNDDSATIYLVDYTWGNELIRFVLESPVQETP